MEVPFPPPRPSRDVDGVVRSRLTTAAAWSFFAAFFMGLAVYVAAGIRAAAIAFFAILIGGIVVAFGVSELAGAAVGRLTDPSVGVRPKRLSRAQTLTAQGRLSEAVTELEAAVRDAPDDLEAYLLLARLHRDETRDLEGAVRWFRAARDRARLAGNAERVLHVELVETLRRIEPRRAAPELARMAERFEGTPDGEWARRELEEIKVEMERDRD